MIKLCKVKMKLMAAVMVAAISMTACSRVETNNSQSADNVTSSAQTTQDVQTEDVSESNAAKDIVTEGETKDENDKDESLNVMNYENKLFDNTYVHTIDILIADEDWEDLLENPLSKTKYKVDVVIDGETFQNVSFATKGNTSLSSVASNPDSDRYSFKLNFDKFVKGQSYYGLDKINLNNIYADATYMKDYLSYEIFRAAEVEAPLTSYVQININGEEFGLYLAIEEIGESYLERTAEGEGELYKPESDALDNADKQMDGNKPDWQNRGDMPDWSNGERPEGEMPQGNWPNGEMPEGGMPQGNWPNGEMPEGEMPQGNWPNGEMPKGEMPQRDWSNGDFKGGFGKQNGASLVYTDDDISSYSDVFDNAETDVTSEDQNRVIEALYNLSQGNVTEALDVESVINYFVAHNFVMNYDSYTGNMLHNYYLYENEGKLSMLPWDYNLAFGAFSKPGVQGRFENQNSGSQNADSQSTLLVNYGIDSPLMGTEEDDRPMWSFIIDNEDFLNMYHEAFNKLITSYFESGEFEKEASRVYEMIRPYVEKDKSAFYTVDKFDTAYENLVNFCSLRAESIRSQLDGNLSTITSEQDEMFKVDASMVDIQAMGSMNGNGGKGWR